MMVTKNKQTPKAGNRDAYLCYCEQITADDFRDRIERSGSASFERVCADTGLASKCTACLLNAETIFIETARTDDLGTWSKPNSRARQTGWSRQRLYGLIDTLSPDVARTVPGIIPVIAGTDISTTVTFANTIPPVIGSRAPAFDVKVETRDTAGKIVMRDSGRVEPGKRLKFEISKGIGNVDGPDSLATGGCFLTYKAVEPGYIGSIRPHLKVITPTSVTSVHSAGAGRNDAFMEACFVNPSERQYVSAINCTDKSAEISMTLLYDGGEHEAGKWKIPPRGTRLILVPADAVPSGTIVGVVTKADREIRWHYVVAEGSPPRISLDHI